MTETGASRPPTAFARADIAAVTWSSPLVIAATLDGAGFIRDVNPAFERMAAMDPRGTDVVSCASEGQRLAFRAWMTGTHESWVTRTWSLLPDADLVPRDLRVSMCRPSDDEIVLVGEPLPEAGLTLALRDVNDDLVDEQRRLNIEGQRLHRAAEHDVLTGLANRRAFDSRLAIAVSAALSGTAFALVMMDVDHFKSVNDRFGHPAGDAVLSWLGSTLQAAARQGDLVARYGGEEFVALLSGAHAAGAAAWAERVRVLVSVGPAPVPGGVTISAGVAAWRPGDIAADGVRRADLALYAAKAAGRDRVMVSAGETPRSLTDDGVVEH